MPTTVKYPHVQVQLAGQDGNAFMVIGLCSKAARRAGLTQEQINEFADEAMSGDYDHLLATAMQYFDVI